MNLFICSTPYHIFNAINLVSNSDIKNKSDLIILDYSDECIKIYERINKEEKKFNSVKLINVKEKYSFKNNNSIHYFINNFKKISNAFFYKKLEKTLSYKNDYECIFIGGPDLPSQLIFQYYNNINDADLCVIEDGVYTYNFLNNISKKKSFFSKMVYGYYYMDLCKKVYVYDPNLFLYSEKLIEICTIPKIDRNDAKLTNYLNNVYAINKNKNIKEDFIFFDSSFFNDIEEKLQLEIILNISKIIRKEDLIIKLHPRSNQKKYPIHTNIVHDKEAFEMKCISQDMNKKILISVISTACLTPKLIYKDEPYVILLYKLIDPLGTRWGYTDIFFEKFKESYKKDKVFIPKNSNELKNIIEKIIKNR